MSHQPRRASPIRDVAIGVSTAGALLWIFLWGSIATIQVLTLIGAVTALIWFATTDQARLRQPSTGGIDIGLFGLAAVGVALLVVGVVFVGTVTSYLQLLIGLAAVTVGLVRALGRGPT